jgi:hypothetical protein
VRANRLKQRGDVTAIVCFGDKNAPDEKAFDALNEETRSASITNGKLFCRLVTASKDGTVAHFDLETNAELRKREASKARQGKMGKKTATADPRRSRGQKGSCDDVETNSFRNAMSSKIPVLSTQKVFFC